MISSISDHQERHQGQDVKHQNDEPALRGKVGAIADLWVRPT